LITIANGKTSALEESQNTCQVAKVFHPINHAIILPGTEEGMGKTSTKTI
jgi:hypothetical protein